MKPEKFNLKKELAMANAPQSIDGDKGNKPCFIVCGECGCEFDCNEFSECPECGGYDSI